MSRLPRIPDFAAFIKAGEDDAFSNALLSSASIGRPLGDAAFLNRLEGFTRRPLRPGKRGPKQKRQKVHCHRNSTV